MARLPSAADLGATPSVSGARPIVDVTAGATAMAKAGQQLGKGIADLGTGVAELELDYARHDYATARADFLSKKIDLESSLAHDQDFTTLQQRYEDGVNKIRDEAASRIQLPGMRTRFVEMVQPEISRGVASVKNKAFELEGHSNVTYVSEQGDKFIDQGNANPTDGALQSKVIETHGAQVDGLVSRGYLTPEQGLNTKREWASRYAISNGVARAGIDPMGVINELRAAPGSPQQIDNRIAQIESGGDPLAKSKTSSASGIGQFLAGTWLPLIREAHPELAGRSDEDLLALRADRGLSMEMLTRYREQNTAYLTKNGVQPTAGNVYLAHFLGPAGAAAVAKASPSTPVQEVLASVVGKETAAKMVAANISVLSGQTAGSVAEWAADRMGGVGPGGGHIYDLLRPDQRATLLERAEAQLHQRKVTDFSDFQIRVRDSESEAARTGAVTSPISKEEFIARVGPEQGEIAFQQHQANVQLGQDATRLARLDPGEQQELYESYAPKAGQVGYDAAAKRQDALGKAIASISKEKHDDPASYAVNRLPASSTAWQTLQTAFSNQEADDGDRAGAARRFAATTLMEQTRVGVAPDAQRIVPKNYVEQFNSALQKAAQSDDATARVSLISRIQNEAQMWGEYWPQVMRQIAPTVQPIVRAIAAGADPVALTRLLSLPKDANPHALLRQQNEAKAADLTKSVNTEMAPFMQSLVGRQRDRDFAGYHSLVEQLGALYVRDGQSANDAAETAFKAVIGNRYDFRDTYRIPKSAGVSADDVQAGTNVARDLIGSGKAAAQLQHGIAPAINDMGISDGAADSFSKFARDGKWVTSQNNDGLNLVYGDKFVRDGRGRPLMLPWAQLGDLAKQNAGKISPAATAAAAFVQ